MTSKAPTDQQIAATLGSIFANLLQAADAEAAAAYERVRDEPLVALAATAAAKGELVAFSMALPRAHEQVLDGLLQEAVPHSREARFLLKHARFVEAQVRARIEAAEGNACAGDKTRFIMKGLLHFFMRGQELVFDRSQPYAYHLPHRVLASHAEAVAFFDAVRRLHGGQADVFVKILIGDRGTP